MRTTGHRPGERAGLDDRGQRRGGGGERVGSDRQERGDRDDGVDDEGDPERERDGPGDRAGGVADLLAERGDAGVAGEREEQQGGGLEDPADPAVGERPDVRRSSGQR